METDANTRLLQRAMDFSPSPTCQRGFGPTVPQCGWLPWKAVRVRGSRTTPAKISIRREALETTGRLARSDGATMWVVDDGDKKLYAYDMGSRTRDAGKDFNSPGSAGNDRPLGIWSDGATMWVSDADDQKLYAYDMGSRARNEEKDFNTLIAAGNRSPSGIWSDGTTMWVVDRKDNKLYAYDMASQARDTGKDFDSLGPEGNGWPEDIWSDGATMWVADRMDNKLYAYFMPSNGGATAVVPSVSSLAPGDRALTVSWAAPSNDGGVTVIAYDLRYIRSDAPDKADANWTVVEDVWTTGSGTPRYELTGLAGGQQYDVQVRAVNGSGEGPWSAVHTVMTLAQGHATTDFNGDGRTDFVDFFLFADAYGGTDAQFDLDGNGTVDFADFFKFVDAFGS